MKKNIKKLFVFFAVLLEIALLIAQPVYAALPKPQPAFNANKTAQQLENRYHVNKESVEEFGETFNVSQQKAPVPEVDVFFNPSNPKFGEKVTVTAIPKYFQEGTENMYFTWYIKHEGCDLGIKKGDSNWKETCDLNNDDEISVDDWKIEAMRLVANGGFIKSKANYSSDTDNDGYRAHRGGRVNIQKKDYCFLHDFESGENYEMATSEVDGLEDSDGCAGEILCTEKHILSCGVTSETTTVPQYDMGSSSTSSSSSSSGGSSSTSETESSSSGGSGSSSSSSETTIQTPEHEEATEGTNKSYTEIFSDSGYDAECDAETKKTVCPDDTVPLCVQNEDLDLIDPNCTQIIPCLAGGYAAGSDCDKIMSGTVGVLAESCETTVLTEDQIDLKCEHKFPKISGMDVGDGSFGADEENFWGTDPNDPSTIDNENNDESNVAGLGIDKMTWTYSPGDKIGVIVEGQSYMPTKHDDSSVAISFALINNIFEKKGSEGCKLEKGVYEKKIKNYTVKIPFAYVNIDDCLEYNLTKPTSGDQADNMEVSMDYYPKNPNVGSMGVDGAGQSKGGDELVVTTNTSDPNVDVNQIYYKWSIYGFSGNKDELDLDQSSWTLLSNNELFRKSNNIKLLEGLGMDQFEMRLNTTEVEIDGEKVNFNFLRFFVESEEFFDTGTGTTGTTRSGRGDVMVEPNQSGAGGINISVGSGTPICLASGNCEVLENQVITATLGVNAETSGVNNYLWTLDGKVINTIGENETKQGNSVTFLLEGRPGDSHVLSVVANDTTSPGVELENKNKGEKLTIDRAFIVTKPMVGIGPNNKINRGSVVDEATQETVCKDLNGNEDETAIMGTYSGVVDPTDEDAEPDTVLDCKERVVSGNGTVTITPTYYPEWIGESLKNVKYSVNGKVVVGSESSGACNSTSCSIDLSSYPVGSMVNISFEAEYWQSDTERFALKEEWGIGEENSGGKKIADTITVKITESNNPTITKKASKIIAGLAYNIPEQMIFMFRLMLTVVTIIFAAGLVMSLGKKDYNNF